MKLLKIWVSLYVLIMPLAGVCDISKDILADPAADKCLELLGKEHTGQEIYDSTAGIMSENYIVSGVYNAWGDVHFRYLTTFSQNGEKITLKDGYSEIQKYVSGLPEEVFVRENESAETGNNTDAASSEESSVPDTAN